MLVREAICPQRPAVHRWGLGPRQGLLSSSKIAVWLWSQACPQLASLSHSLCHWPHGRAGLHLLEFSVQELTNGTSAFKARRANHARSLPTRLIMKLHMRLCCDLTNNSEESSLRKDQALPDRLAAAFEGLRHEMEKDHSGAGPTWYNY